MAGDAKYDVTWRVEPYSTAAKSLETLHESLSGRYFGNPGSRMVEAWDLSVDEVRAFEDQVRQQGGLVTRHDRPAYETIDETQMLEPEQVAMMLMENTFDNLPSKNGLEVPLGTDASEHMQEARLLESSGESYSVGFRPFEESIDVFHRLKEFDHELMEGIGWGVSRSRGVVEMWGESCKSTLPMIVEHMREAGFGVIECDHPDVTPDERSSFDPRKLSAFREDGAAKMRARDNQKRLLG